MCAKRISRPEGTQMPRNVPILPDVSRQQLCVVGNNGLGENLDRFIRSSDKII